MTQAPVPGPETAIDAPELAIITGMSGAGRTTAAKVLEDLGFFVIDNMPPSLIERVVELATARGSSVDRIALVVDVRGQEFFGDLRGNLATLAERGLDPMVVFLEAADEVLVRRYEAERRTHPLSGNDRIVDGIARERDVLADLRAQADLVIDTTQTSVHDLRDRLTDAFGRGRGGLAVNVVSFGFKHGTPRDADIVLDVRFLPNPHWVEELRPYTGLDAPVRDYVLGQEATEPFLAKLYELFDLMVPAFVREGKHYLTVAIGCTGGRHRSVVLAEELAGYISRHHQDEVAVQVDHRDREGPST
ncbi:RNase adapter RapZ [Egibacter rhizosphaerae]|uniref:RNase adapter RapZ n=1 Tax=Egibacter rhizosphaerae TaxID=1670831 RepID=A0A411YKQ5_9ACTN|nr:RNase adapter RapZ [Egibacter rhizosphaerae]QBI21763.1 RNase adapter RapZ [Egibacter rhizosphaerae]